MLVCIHFAVACATSVRQNSRVRRVIGWFLTAIIVAGLVVGGSIWPPPDEPGSAPQSSWDPCTRPALTGAHKSTTLTLDPEREPTFPGTVKIKIPMTWELSADLLEGPTSQDYRRAMRCLL